MLVRGRMVIKFQLFRNIYLDQRSVKFGIEMWSEGFTEYADINSQNLYNISGYQMQLINVNLVK